MIIHIRTGLPHGHLLNHAENMKVHVHQLTQCATQLREAGERLQECLVGFKRLVEHL